MTLYQSLIWESAHKGDETLELDDIDRQILMLLHNEARMPLQELATRIGLSRAAVHDRVKKLIQSGVIRGFELRVDPDLLGYPVLAWIGLLTVQGTEAYRTLEDLSHIPEIEAAYVVTGHYDFLVKVRARSNAHLQQLLFEKIDQVHGFQRSETMVVLSAAVDKGTLDPKLYQSV
ncbi:Lrp/AsnC family transcriptional regulator [Sulfobacillus thermosulfidooxidans]|uniref:Lrp/AsnC family transcriptional regulator n=1 Tax=Sulfobacillus thermosulfidooxidans TaxID=28034 RepID=UPI000A7AC58F|nr:Lrp/AsnC family transcriptional regulator [Sulfobacillus thermosulfidooxidans]